jgi:flagellar biogenesis protein FliO
MQIRQAPAWITCLAWAFLGSSSAAQQYPPSAAPDSLVYPRPPAVTLDEPRPFILPTTVDPRPVVPAYPSPPPTLPPVAVPRYPQPPVNFRLASAEEVISHSPAKPPLKLAPRTAVTRQPVNKPAAPTPGGALGTVAGSLGVVLGLFLVVAWCLRRFSPAGSVLLPKEVVELLGRSPLAGRQQMQLVRIGNKLLLVALSPGGAETLTEITDATEVEHLTALSRRRQPSSSAAAFQQALAQLGNEPAERGFIGSTRAAQRGGR